MQIQDISNQEMIFFLSRVSGIGNVSISKIYQNIQPMYQLLYLSEEEMIQRLGIRREKIQAILIAISYWEEAHEEYRNLKEQGIRFLSIEDQAYPKKLKEIENYPMGLYVKGNLPSQEEKIVAIVGSRNASHYGLEMARYIARTLAKEGIAVVSGLAYGIDSAAHRGALEIDFGKTYGILGTGVNICYPKENYAIYQQILKKGAVFSEYPLFTPPLSKNFPLRNRIIAGLSDIIVVIEARERSGSLITVGHGLNQGKEVFAVPGRITDVMSRGCNKLISDGAGILTSVEDILEAFSILTNKKLPIREKNINLLAKNQKKVYSCLDLEPKYIEQIVEDTKLDIGEVYMALLELELSGYIYQISRNYYGKVLDIR